MTFLPPLEDAARVSCFLADQPRWSVFWDKKHGLWRVAEDDPDSDLYAESSDADAYDRLVILRCTKKLLGVMRLPLADPAPEPDPEDWYANLLWFDRRKCLLLTHSATLVISHAVDPLDGDDVMVYHVEDPVPADAKPVVPAPVEPLRRVRVIGQGGDSHADRTHAVLVTQVTAG